MVGVKALRMLLAPRHPQFAYSGGTLVDWREYLAPDGARYGFPVVEAPSFNPYKRTQVRKRSTGRTYRRLEAAFTGNGVVGATVVRYEPTFPKQISEWVTAPGMKDDRKPRENLLWRVWEAHWKDKVEPMLLAGRPGRLAAAVNLHLWNTARPTNPHAHFHATILGVVALSGDPDLDEFRERLERLDVRQAKLFADGDLRVPFSDADLEELKADWLARIRRFCKRNGIDWHGNKINLNTGFVEWDKSSRGRSQVVNRLTYQQRLPVEDFVRVHGDDPDGPAMPSWLQLYKNSTRAFGWWTKLKQFADHAVEDGSVPPDDGNGSKRVAPDGEEVEFVKTLSVEEVLAEPVLYSLEMVKGHQELGLVDDDLRAWLRWAHQSPDQRGDPPAAGVSEGGVTS